MGLDMYLQGHCYKSGNRETLDGFPIKEITVELGYWRKHPNLHGAIVQTFAEGVDECQTIELNKDDIEKLIEMVKTNQLPHTTGFFFGESARPGSERYEQEYNDTIKQLENALKWYEGKEPDTYRWVSYRASW
jgi:hypothetical protein